jgi:hypothetical protein
MVQQGELGAAAANQVDGMGGAAESLGAIVGDIVGLALVGAVLNDNLKGSVFDGEPRRRRGGR